MTKAVLFFAFASVVWAADGSPPSVAQTPPPLSAEQKLEIVKIQRDIALIDREEQRNIEQVKSSAESQRQQLQRKLQEIAGKLVPKGWNLNPDLEFVPAKVEPEPPKEP